MPKITKYGGPSHEGFDEPPATIPVIETGVETPVDVSAKTEPTPKVEVKAETPKTTTRRPRL